MPPVHASLLNSYKSPVPGESSFTSILAHYWLSGPMLDSTNILYSYYNYNYSHLLLYNINYMIIVVWSIIYTFQWNGCFFKIMPMIVITSIVHIYRLFKYDDISLCQCLSKWVCMLLILFVYYFNKWQESSGVSGVKLTSA